MRIGIGLPTRDAPAELLLEWAARAERGPFSSVAVSDRVVYDAQEPLVALAAAAAATRRVRLLASVIIVPTRETTLLARQCATLDAISNGRFTLATGVGVREDDYVASGQRFHRRGRRLDEQLPLLRRIWSGEAIAGGVIGPRPRDPRGPELLVGGYTSVVARRIAAWGDGFMAPGGGEPAALRALWSEIGAAWTHAGRAGRPRWVGGGYFALGPNAEVAARSYVQASYGFDPKLAERRLRTLPTTVAAVRDAIARQADMGVDEYILRPCAPDLEHLERLADVVVALPASA